MNPFTKILQLPRKHNTSICRLLSRDWITYCKAKDFVFLFCPDKTQRYGFYWDSKQGTFNKERITALMFLELMWDDEILQRHKKN